MRTSTILALAASTLALASPLLELEVTHQFAVTKFVFGCSASCSWSFNVTVQGEFGNHPELKTPATCSGGLDEDHDYKKCVGVDSETQEVFAYIDKDNNLLRLQYAVDNLEDHHTYRYYGEKEVYASTSENAKLQNEDFFVPEQNASHEQYLYLETPKGPSVVIAEASYPSCGPNELIIKATAMAINPAEVIVQKTGMLLTKYPAVLGCDAAGVVVELGANLTSRFQVGEHVLGATSPLEDYKYDRFQEYVVLKAPSIARFPENFRDVEAVVLPFGFNTAASCLFAKETLGLNLPGNTAADYEVMAIASEKNHGILRNIGAGECFGYHDPDMAKRITEKPKGKRVVGALDAIPKQETIGTPCEILEHVDAEEKVMAAVPPGAEAWAENNVVVKTNFGFDKETFGR
ncbi:hypothetical protein AC578_7808 [Pseudocercospora eumusae]|uniref:Alcohol dehydrogenase-like N-terminal domain-containing protein n=1 Tax=Pseudocercospora eumusae TaxID=321146 RepID=A0A139GTX1_9PEZI|nr:hypothetical protein AC578_7808 [Pseudocercospora eumusae]